MKQHQHDSIDLLLKKTLSSAHAPDELLNQRTKNLMKEKMVLKKTSKKSMSRMILIASMLTIAMSVTAFAIWNLLSADEFADHVQYPVLAEAFRSEGAIQINESVTSNGYKITLLGIVSGKGLTPLPDNADIEAEKSYAVVAIENLNGKMPDTSEAAYDDVPFFISPLVKGLIPWHINIATMSGGYSSSVIDGVMYRLIECDSIEMFADRGLYLAVSSSTFYDTEAFVFDFQTGEISPNPDYKGVNVLFDLPIDKTKADPQKSQQFLEDRYGGDYKKEMKQIEIHVKVQQYLDENYRGDRTEDEVRAKITQFLEERYKGDYTEEMIKEMVEGAMLKERSDSSKIILNEES
ncbi:DUF4179 domain-containing protein [Geosporobacter ferrireducens]|uniref:Uncharacterized protein n=1 Tax=Geosporobacter ferrireducens TaxID=1424294 RepID=A0A1D8GI91_9FIRM|nr:DUF4179 domain-containing protein [Geosporobacter ferrireducens]AOT70625.1 hypothetical protein Gferi_14225 [Geosporobacter ferrireducens]MTI57421.1 DUF4179 domain-containing protein [Geosporobacter ferrireducens]